MSPPPFAEFPSIPIGIDPQVATWAGRLREAMSENYRRLRSAVWTIGPAVASAAEIAPSGNVFHVTDSVDITSIDISRFNPIVLIFDAHPNVIDGGNLKLAGNFGATANDTLTLAHDGTNWFEIRRSVN